MNRSGKADQSNAQRYKHDMEDKRPHYLSFERRTLLSHELAASADTVSFGGAGSSRIASAG